MDHERVNVSPTQMSCGILELSRINEDTDGVLFNIASRLYHPSRGNPCAIIIYSDINAAGSASERLTLAVGQHKLGEVTCTAPVENPRTGNFIVVYTWVVDHDTFKAYYAEQRVIKMKKVGAL